MADETMRTLISLGSFSPVGGGGGEIPEDLCVCTLHARKSIDADCEISGALGQFTELNTCLDLTVGGDISAANGEFNTLQACTVSTTSNITAGGWLYAPSGSIGTVRGEYACFSGQVHTCNLHVTEDAEVCNNLTVGGNLSVKGSVSSPIEDLPVYTATGTFTLRNGKKYQIKADCTTKYPCFNFSNVVVEGDATSEIWFKVGSRNPQDILLPSDWKWVGTELDDCIPSNTTLSIAVRKVAGYNGVAGNDVTVANVAYQYTAPAGS